MQKVPIDVHFWCEREEEYLKLLHKTCLELVIVYRKLYVSTSRLQNKLRLPAIVLSSLTGAASFSSSSFSSGTSDPQKTQRFINLGIGLVNVFIAMIQTYETFKKVGDILSNSILTSFSLKKLADEIHCMVFIPIGDREISGSMYLRDAFNKYQSIMEKAPPLERATKDYLRFEEISEKIKLHIKSNYLPIRQIEYTSGTHMDDIRSVQSIGVSQMDARTPPSSLNRSDSIESYNSEIFRKQKIKEESDNIV